MDLLQARRSEISARLDVLPAQVKAWSEATLKEVDSQLHFSQVRAVREVLGILCETARTKLGALAAGDTAAQLGGLLDTTRALQAAEKYWDYFREKLDLRRLPSKEALWIADTVAWNCYKPVMDAAVQEGALTPGELSEPPLTYPAATLSPLTWMRGLRPNDGRTFLLDAANSLPFAVIELPWEQLDNPWELMAIPHEVGHDLERDLKLGKPLREALASALKTAGVPLSRQRLWDGWMSEVFADLVGLQLGGPAFIEALATLIAFPMDLTKHFDSSDPHPTLYLRPLLLAAALPHLIPNEAALAAEAERLRTVWLALYGDAPPALADFADDFAIVGRALLDTPFPVLGGRSVRELIPYRPEDDAAIRAAAPYLRTGFNQPQHIEPRHAISAARMAITETMASGDEKADAALLAGIRQRTGALVRKHATPGVRAGGPDRKAVYAAIAERIQLAPLEFMGREL